MIPPLKTAGLLHATRGPRGGYMLARKPGQITIRDIVSSLEGPISLVDCVATPATCVRSVSCTAREAWGEIDRKLNAAMAAITLGTLVQRHRKHAK
jgi:Rrf2 family protein